MSGFNINEHCKELDARMAKNNLITQETSGDQRKFRDLSWNVYSSCRSFVFNNKGEAVFPTDDRFFDLVVKQDTFATEGLNTYFKIIFRKYHYDQDGDNPTDHEYATIGEMGISVNSIFKEKNDSSYTYSLEQAREVKKVIDGLLVLDSSEK